MNRATLGLVTILLAASSATQGGCVATVGIRSQARPGTLVEISPGVWVVSEYSQPVFFYGNAYWWWNGGVWYSSHYVDYGYRTVTLSAVPIVIREIREPRAYIDYRGGGRATRPLPPGHVRQPYPPPGRGPANPPPGRGPANPPPGRGGDDRGGRGPANPPPGRGPANPPPGRGGDDRGDRGGRGGDDRGGRGGDDRGGRGGDDRGGRGGGDRGGRGGGRGH